MICAAHVAHGPEILIDCSAAGHQLRLFPCGRE